VAPWAAAEACIDVVPKNPHNFNVDNVRVVKINGEQGRASKTDCEPCTAAVATLAGG
jgi:hypothetical protein